MLFELNPNHPGGQFVRTIRIAGQPARKVRWQKPGQRNDLNAAEQEVLAGEIARQVIGPAGKPSPEPPPKPRPKLHPSEDYRDFDAEDHFRRIPKQWCF